ncbi:hypothetical protein [Ureibacillus thermophilus]|uniref:hypothetical protein n=1 Tax=Ureibacillus thermophilus TaxID=367743 RepID=UPI001ABF1BCF|nr:hypothetical protein [Ureibacillus thermophilus]
MPLMQTVIFSIYPVEKRGLAMGMSGLVVGFAPAIGPTLAGRNQNRLFRCDAFRCGRPASLLLPYKKGKVSDGKRELIVS